GGGSCAGTPVVCVPGECQTGGICNALTGQCTFGTANDGDACTGGACSGDPITGAHVIVGGVSKTTGSSGRVTYSGIASGPTVARITATLYAPASPSLEVQAGSLNSI